MWFARTDVTIQAETFMREEIADKVYPTLEYGLKLRERLQRGDRLEMDQEQARLRGLLQTSQAAMHWPDYGGDGDQFLGMRYALTCWLDEIFILGSRWSAEWNERSLEVALYQMRNRSFAFWDQARIAEARSEMDALEVFYLCVMLGFRGDYRERPQELLEWRDNVEAQIGQRRAARWPGQPPELPPVTNVPPLLGQQRLRTSLLVLGAVVGLLIPIVTFSLVTILRNL